MEELIVLSGKKTAEIENNRKKKSSPTSSVIETPDPPQVMDPSATPSKRKKRNQKHPKKLDSKTD